MSTQTPRNDRSHEIADKIIQCLEEGVSPWRRPWDSGLPGLPLRANGEPYKGINVLILWLIADKKAYTNPFWFTYRQANELGAQVRKGEKSTPVIFYKALEIEDETDPDGEASIIRLRRFYNVFNGDQIDDLPERFRVHPGEASSDSPTLDPRVEAFFDAIDATVIHGGPRAFYDPAADEIHLPFANLFATPAKYWATRAHETIHFTSAPSRCDRPVGKNHNDPIRCMEELVAEIGSAILGAHLGLPPDHIEDHAAYVGSWLEGLKNDRNMVFKAAAEAQKAVDFLFALQSTAEQSAEAA